jgi:hypothetical protein
MLILLDRILSLVFEREIIIVCELIVIDKKTDPQQPIG